jgi:integrase
VSVTGVYRGKYGLRVVAKANGHRREHHIKYGTPNAYEKAAAWQDDARNALRKLRPPTTGRRGTFGVDVKTYLAQVKPTLAPATYGSRVCELDAYLAVFRNERRADITRARLLELRTTWMTEGRAKRNGVTGASAKTVRNREGALRHLYHVLDGKKAPTPLDDLPLLPKTPAEPKFVTIARILRVWRNLADDPPTRAWYMVLNSTGQRPAQVRRTLRTDLNFRRGTWSVRPAKGGNPIPVTLTRDMIAAWKAFIAADCFDDAGKVRPMDGSDYAKRLYAAGWPKNVRPYNAKHTVALTLAELGVEWNDVKDFFGHKDIKTTEIYTGLVAARTRASSGKLAGRFGWK